MSDKRNDITNWLIHFTKEVSIDDVVDVYRKFPADDDSFNFELDYSNQLPLGQSKLTAFDVLKKIVQECGIRFGYSFRNKKTTLYGGAPVICFTEMPIKHFLQYAKTRTSNLIDSYGIAITKKAAYRYGARPVIYGLSTQTKFSYVVNEVHSRILPEEILPLREQYRLVSYNPQQNIDWTHEREWRITSTIEAASHTFHETEMDLKEVAVLNIFAENEYCDNIVLIVPTKGEADELFDQVLILLDSKSNEFGIEFLPKRITILVIDQIKNEDLEVSAIEDLSANCYFEVQIEVLNSDEKNNLRNIINRAKDEVSLNAERQFHKETKMHKHELGYFLDSCGSAAITSNNPRNKYLRELINIGIASSYGDGYHIDAIGNVHTDQSVTYHEYIADKVCEFLNREIDDIFTRKTYID